MSNAAPGEASTLQEEAARAASQAGLRHVCDGEPGIARRRAGPHFTYVMPDGATVTDEAVDGPLLVTASV